MEAAMAASQEGTAAAQAAALTWHQSEEEKRAPLTWSRELTFSLIECWSERFNMLGGGNLTRSHWEKIAKTLIENHPGLDISWKQCQDKLQNLRKAFKAHVSKEEYKGGIGKSAMEWPYFEAMALALGKKGKAVSSTPNFGSGGMGFSQHRGASVGLANELGGERNGGEFSNPEHEHRKAMSSGNNGGEEDGLKVMTKKKKRKVLSDDASASLMERILEAQTRAEERQMQADERDKQWKKDMMEMALAFQLRIAQTLAQALAQPPPEKPRDR